MKGTKGMTTIDPPQAASGQAYERGGLLAPWWHTALMVLLIIGLSVAGVRQLRSFGDKPLHLVANYSLTIAYEWILAALIVLAVLGETLVKISGSHIDPQKIGDVTQKLAPVTGLEMMLFLVLSISAGFCEELVFRGYLQQQFARMGRRIWVGVALSALVFGGAHGYEGVAGVLLIAAYGAMFGVLALLRRGLRTGMIAHAWHDSISGVALVLLRHYGVHLAGK